MAMDPNNPLCYFDGGFVPLSEAKISVMTHAFNYGTGCFEGIRGNWIAEHEQKEDAAADDQEPDRLGEFACRGVRVGALHGGVHEGIDGHGECEDDEHQNDDAR